MAGKLPLYGVHAVVENYRGFIRDMDGMKGHIRAAKKDLKQMAAASIKGQGEAAVVAGRLAKKYGDMAVAAREASLQAMAQGKMAKAGRLAEQAQQAGALAARYTDIAKAGDGTVSVMDRMRSASEFLQKNWFALTAAAGSVVAVVKGVEKAFEFGREGAAIAQTRESFDMLLQKFNIAPSMLDEMSSAVNHTVAETDLMTSSLTLAAGANDEVAEALLRALPDLALYSKAASKLNPALGDTTFMLDSIARGIKRNSPLLIDNTGLKVTAGEANKVYAEQLGLEATKLTDVQQQLALLNLVQIKGQRLVEQAGGSVESLTDDYDKLGVQTQRATERIKQQIDKAVRPLANELAKLLTTINDVSDGMETGFGRGAARTSEEWQELIEVVQHGESGLKSYSSSMVGLAAMVDNAVVDMGTSFNTGLTPALTDVESALDAVKIKSDVAWGSVNVGVRSNIASLKEEIAFIQAGGGEIIAAYEAVKKGMQEGVIAPEDASAMLEDLELAALAVDEEVGKIWQN